MDVKVKQDTRCSRTARARRLRTDATNAERKLWTYLRNRRLTKCKFRRQQPIGAYIADFVCFENRIIIEADGGQHSEQAIYDSARTAYLESRGFRVLRFWNNDVLLRTESVLEIIHRELKTPHPGPRQPLHALLYLLHPCSRLPQGERE